MFNTHTPKEVKNSSLYLILSRMTEKDKFVRRESFL